MKIVMAPASQNPREKDPQQVWKALANRFAERDMPCCNPGSFSVSTLASGPTMQS